LSEGSITDLWLGNASISNLIFSRQNNALIFSTGGIHEENAIYLLTFQKDVTLIKKYKSKIYWDYNQANEIIITQYHKKKPEFIDVNKYKGK
jgi:hypothetical protein